MQRTPWIERRFSFGLPPGWMPNVLERLRGTPTRIFDIVAGVPNERLVARASDKWSIQEHIGHLIHLETKLHDSRVDDFISLQTTLRPWEGNAAVDNAGYNKWAVDDLLENLEGVRARFVHRLAMLSPEVMDHQSLHPRLQVMMRPVDMAFFVAEHDDHHLATIRELIG